MPQRTKNNMAFDITAKLRHYAKLLLKHRNIYKTEKRK